MTTSDDIPCTCERSLQVRRVRSLKDLSKPAWLLLVATVPVAAMITWNITLPLLLGQPVTQFTEVISANNQCPPLLDQREERLFLEQESTTVQVLEKLEYRTRQGKDKDRLLRREPLLLKQTFHQDRRGTEPREYRNIQLYHWYDGKLIAASSVLQEDTRQSECAGGVHYGVPEDLKDLYGKVTSSMERNLIHIKQKDACTWVVGRKFTGIRPTWRLSCDFAIYVQLSGATNWRVRVPIHDESNHGLNWKVFTANGVSEGDVLFLPPVSHNFMAVTSFSAVGLFANITKPQTRPLADIHRTTLLDSLHSQTDAFNGNRDNILLCPS